MSENNEYDWKKALAARGTTEDDNYPVEENPVEALLGSMSTEDAAKSVSEDEESEEGLEESSESDLQVPDEDEEEDAQPDPSVSGGPNFQKGAPQTAVKAYIANKGRSRKTRKYFPTKTRW